ncbi:MAG: hypothetical protein N3D12_04515 [Candidatus Methanomethyliaceae archaeon]|nr:hypothetical protein [Candidatus Methanomethyliaceae archaeon]
MNITINLSHISGEKLMEAGGTTNIQITTNISVVKLTPINDSLECSFIFNVNYNPAVATLTIKGVAKVTGDKKELEEIKKSFEGKRMLPSPLLQTIANVSFIEGVILARSLNIPPPLPLPTIPQPPESKEGSVRPSYIA